MWDETLIESRRKSDGKRKWSTVTISVVFHVVLILTVAFATFWNLEAVPPTFPSTPFVRTAGLPADVIPVAMRPRLGTPQGDNKPVKSTPVLEPTVPVTQQSIDPNSDVSEVPDAPQSSLPFDPSATAECCGTGPQGTPDGDPDAGLDTAGYPDKPIEITVGVEQPVLVHRVLPQYPETMRRIRKEGYVVLKAIISRNGDVEVKSVAASLHPVLDREAVNAVSQWKYRPATVGGRPVSVWFTVTVSFKLVQTWDRRL